MTMKHILHAVLMFALSLSMALGVWGGMPAGKVAAYDCAAIASGNWSNSATWSGCNGGVPGPGDNVTISSTYTVVVDADSEVNNITLEGTTGTRLTLNAVLSVLGTLNGSTTNPSSSLITGSGRLRFVGSSRALFGTNWGANPPGWNLEIALDAGAIGTASTRIKAANIIIASGTFSTPAQIRPDNGTSGVATLTIDAGATLIIADTLQRIGTANTAFTTFTNNGTFRTSSSSTNVWPSGTTCIFAADSIVEYTRTGDQIIQTPNGGSYGNLVLSGNGMKTAPASLQIQGNFAINSGVTGLIPAINVPVVTGTVTNDGILQQTQTVSDATVSFLTISTDKYRGVDIETPNNLGVVTVTVQGNADSCTNDPTSPAYIKRCFSITPTNNATATLTLWATDGEMNGIDFLSGDEGALYRYVTNQWIEQTRVEFGTDTGGYNYVMADVDGFSSFLLGESGVTPTAVTYAGIKSGAALWAPVSLLFLGGAAVVLRKRR